MEENGAVTMHPVSAIQFDTAVARRTPPIEKVRSGVWSIPQPLRPVTSVESTLCYGFVGGDGRIALIDPGWDTPDNRARLLGWIDDVGGRIEDVTMVIATHLHADHLGLAEWIRERTGAELVLHTDEWVALQHPTEIDEPSLRVRWGVPDSEPLMAGQASRVFLDHSPDRLLTGGETVDAAGTLLTVLATPGHTTGSICLVDGTRRLLFAGDHVLPVINPGIGLGDPAHADPLGDYLASLDALEPYDDAEVCPGHGYRFTGLRDRREEIAAHHMRRNEEVRGVMDRLSQPSVWQVAEQVIWTDGWDGLRGLYRRSALAQTEMHVRYLGRADELAR